MVKRRVSDEQARDVYENVSRVVIAYGDVRVHNLAADLLDCRAALKAVCEAADEMRSVLLCDTGKRAGAGCVYHCTNCSIAEDYDAARAAMGEAP